MSVLSGVDNNEKQNGNNAAATGGGGIANRFAEGVKAAVTVAAIGLALAGPMVSFPGVAEAGGKRSVGEISASGLVFKVRFRAM